MVALYEKGIVHHVGHPAPLTTLESQLLTWVPSDESPDRMDALVHAVAHLALRFVPATVSSPTQLVGGRTPDDRLEA